ncbi:MAG: hypothetical protein H0X03_01515 [Nitrosopumilus sp.]|nr:hypothetical protein [Nitrosopumilus sp.]
MNNTISKKNVEFETVREIWNKYELENGTIIKSRFYISQVIEIIRDGNISYEFKMENQTSLQHSISNTITNPPLSKTPVSIDPTKDLDKEMNFQTLFNKSQIYELENQTFLFIYEKVNHMWSTKKLDSQGNVVYYLDFENKINIFKPNI